MPPRAGITEIKSLPLSWQPDLQGPLLALPDWYAELRILEPSPSKMPSCGVGNKFLGVAYMKSAKGNIFPVRSHSGRGRPPKQRPHLGDPVTAGMSNRDIALALGTTRREIALWLDYAKIPEREFNQLLASPDFSVSELKKLARLRANKSLTYERKCPHCGALLRIEGQN